MNKALLLTVLLVVVLGTSLLVVHGCPSASSMNGYTVTTTNSVGVCPGVTIGPVNTGGTSGTYTKCYKMTISTAGFSPSDVPGISNVIFPLCESYMTPATTVKVFRTPLDGSSCTQLVSGTGFNTEFKLPSNPDPNLCISGVKFNIINGQKNVIYYYCITVPTPLVSLQTLPDGWHAGNQPTVNNEIEGIGCFTPHEISGTIDIHACEGTDVSELTTTVSLLNKGTTVMVVSDLQDGDSYTFPNVPPSDANNVYTLVVTSIPGYSVSPTSPIPIVVAGSDVVQDIDFYQLGNIHGTVTIQDDGGLEGADVSVTCSNGFSDSTTTDSSGEYSVGSVPYGATCTITLTVPGGYTLVTPSSNVISGATICESNDYVVTPSGHTVSGTVDLNMCPGTEFEATLTLNGDTQTITADGDTYTFEDVPDGEYTIEISFASGTWSVDPDPISVTVAGSDVTKDIAITQIGSFSGTVSLDIPPNGQLDNSDPKIPDFYLTITCGSGSPQSVKTSASGAFSVSDIPYGTTCTVAVDTTKNSGFVLILPNPASGDICSPVNVLVGFIGSGCTGSCTCTMRTLGYYKNKCATVITQAQFAALKTIAIPSYYFNLPLVNCPGASCPPLASLCTAMSNVFSASGSGLAALAKQTLTLEINYIRDAVFCIGGSENAGNVVIEALIAYAEKILTNTLVPPATAAQISTLTNIIDAINNSPG